MSEVNVVPLRPFCDGDLGAYYARVRDVIRTFDGVSMSSRIAVTACVLAELTAEFNSRVHDGSGQ